MAKPANPAPKAFINDAATVFNNQGSYIPSEDAIFEKSIENSKVTNLKGSDKQRDALNKLNSTGRQFVDKVQSKCKLKNPTATDSGTIKTGETLVRKMTSSTSGTNCVLEIETDITASAFFNELVGPGGNDDLSNIERASVVVSAQSKMRRTLREQRMIQASGMKEWVLTLGGSGHVKVDKATSSRDINVTVDGTAKLVLANGEEISGPLNALFLVEKRGNSSKVEMTMLFKGSSAQGDIWLGIQVKESKTEVYLNGEKISGGGNVGDLVGAVEAASSALTNAQGLDL